MSDGHEQLITNVHETLKSRQAARLVLSNVRGKVTLTLESDEEYDAEPWVVEGEVTVGRTLELLGKSIVRGVANPERVP